MKINLIYSDESKIRQANCKEENGQLRTIWTRPITKKKQQGTATKLKGKPKSGYDAALGTRHGKPNGKRVSFGQ